MGEEKPSYFGIIPATVRYDKSLKANAKLLYSELTCLSEKDGYCYASNNYFAKLYEVDPSSISKWLKQLADKGYIKIEYKYNGKECTERKIFINTNAKGSAENQEGIDICQEVLPNCQGGIDIRQGGYCQIAKENNTRVNNTSINNIYSPEKSKYVCNESVELCEKLLNYCKNENPHFSTTKKDKWTEDIGKIHFIDGYSWEDIGKVIDFAKTDNFWKANILSGDKLRKQMQRLYLQTSNKNQNTTGWQNINSYQSNQEEKSCL